MANTLDKIVTFFRVSPVQQVTALGLLAPATIAYAYDAIENYSRGNVSGGVASTIFVLGNTGCFLLGEYIAIGKMYEYGQVKSALNKHGWDKRIIEPKSHSWCQRTMAQVASDDAGFGNETKEYLHEKGYRWYHFFPTS